MNRPFDSIVTLPPPVVAQTNGGVTSPQVTMPTTEIGLPSGSVSLSSTPKVEVVVSATNGVDGPA